MFKAALLILTFVRLLLVVGGKTCSSVKNETEIGSNSSRRILHGQRAILKGHPYFVKIHFPSKNDLCGGSIIANHWILTAAHCLRGKICILTDIYPFAWPYPQKISPRQCYVHENNRIGNHEYDIGLLKIRQDLVQDGRAKAIGLPPPGKRYPAGTPILIMGYGKTHTNISPVRLIKANVKLITWESCNRAYLDTYAAGNKDIPMRIECVQGEGLNPAGICFGDSGGPAVTSDNIVIGVASFLLKENNRCKIGTPSMFVSVVDYLPWIYKFVDPSKDTSNFPVRPEHVLN